MKVWSPLLGDCLFDKKKTSNGVGKNAVAIICLNSFRKEEVVGHVPQNISKVVSLYLSPPHWYLEPEATEKRVNRGGGYWSKIPAGFRFYGPEKATQ